MPNLGRLACTCLCLAGLTACSVKRMAVNKLGNALANSGTTFTADEDPELVRDALPFSLKLIEALLAESPRLKANANCASATLRSK